MNARQSTKAIISLFLVLFMINVYCVNATSTEYLYVASYNGTYSTWSKVGGSPWLSTMNYPTAYIVTPLGTAKRDGWYLFADTSNTPLSCMIDFYCMGIYDEDYGYGAFSVYLNDGTTTWSMGSIVTDSTSWKWYSINAWSKLNTQAKVNAAKFYVSSTIFSTERAYIDCARLTMTYTSASWHSIETWTETLNTRQWTNIESWSFTLLTREWNNIESWNFNLTTMQWNAIEKWTFDLITKAFHTIETWTFELISKGWRNIELWSFTLGEESFLILIAFIVIVSACVTFILLKVTKKI